MATVPSGVVTFLFTDIEASTRLWEEGHTAVALRLDFTTVTVDDYDAPYTALNFVEISSGGEVIKTHPIRHDRSRERGAFANPGGRPHRSNAA